MAPKPPPEIVGRVITDFEEDLKTHERFVKKADRCYRAYRGVIERRSQAAKWTNKQHPAYVFQSIETIVASLVDPAPKWRIRARPLVASPEEVERARAGARANELLLNHQLSVDHFPEKQRVIDLQALIVGLTVTKQAWNYREGEVRSRRTVEETIYDDYGMPIGTIPKRVDSTSTEVLSDDPTCIPVDVRDFVWHEGAISLSKCMRVTHRLWYTMDELRQLERLGVYKNVAEVTESKDQTRGAGIYEREQDLFEVNRAKDQIEVLEQWRVDPSAPGGMRVVSVGNRKALLRDSASPFWFDRLEHQFPFMVCSAIPDLFRIPGISDVEMMQELQEMLWTLTNQRLDNLQLINNAIFLIAEDMEDPDSFEFAPGARNLVPRPVGDTVQAWSPNPIVAQVSIEAEGMLKGDLQNVTGGMPFLSGTESQSVDQNTATGVSIVTSLAQRRLLAKKQQFTWAKRRIGEQWCALNQQFVTDDKLVPVVGQDGAEAFEVVRPEVLEGLYVFETEMSDESLMRQEKRAEAQAKLQVAMSAVPVFAALAQQGSAPMLNVKAFMDDYLDAFDIADKERYYSANVPPTGLPQQQPGQPTGAPGLDGQGGITAPQATDPNSPSNAFSQSPVAAMQQMLATAGGPVNQ